VSPEIPDPEAHGVTLQQHVAFSTLHPCWSHHKSQSPGSVTRPCRAGLPPPQDPVLSPPSPSPLFPSSPLSPFLPPPLAGTCPRAPCRPPSPPLRPPLPSAEWISPPTISPGPCPKGTTQGSPQCEHCYCWKDKSVHSCTLLHCKVVASHHLSGALPRGAARDSPRCVALPPGSAAWRGLRGRECALLYCTGTGLRLYCTVLYCAVLYCTVLYCTVLYCTVLYCASKLPLVPAPVV